MKRFVISIGLFFAMGAISAENGNLTVTSVESTPVTGITVITYDLTARTPAKVNMTYNISVEVSFDGGVSGSYIPVPSAHLSGDVENVEPGPGRQITWDGAAGFPNRYSEETRVRLTATEAVFICGESTVTFMYNGSLVTYGTVLIDYEGEIGERCWLDRNLGASRVATSSTDAEAYGDLFQWGRGDDGHQVRNSGTTSTKSTTDTPGHDDFIFTSNNLNDLDWRDQENDNLWQGVDGINNPCPAGYRLPTADEWVVESQSWTTGGYEGAFGSPLKLPMAGYRDKLNPGPLYGEDTRGFYWSSNPHHAYVSQSKHLSFHNDTYDGISQTARAEGMSVRCIKDRVHTEVD